MKQDTHTSSPGRLVALGEIVGTHGVRGLLRFHPYDRSSDLPPTGRTVYLTATRPAPHGPVDPATSRAIVLDDARPHGSIALLSVRGIDSIEAAEPLVGHALALPEAELPAPDANEYYVYQLEGLAVVTETGEPLGTVERSFSNGANEVLVVQNDGREHLIPLIADVVRTVDLTERRIVIDPIPGLLDS
jgi:16S rRNA processing protein RimM